MKEIKKVFIANEYFENEVIVGITENKGRRVGKIGIEDYSGRRIVIELFDKENNKLSTLLIPNNAVVKIIY